MPEELRKELIEKELSHGQRVSLKNYMTSHGKTLRKSAGRPGRRTHVLQMSRQLDIEPEACGLKTILQGGGMKFYAEAEIHRLRMSTRVCHSRRDAEADRET